MRICNECPWSLVEDMGDFSSECYIDQALVMRKVPAAANRILIISLAGLNGAVAVRTNPAMDDTQPLGFRNAVRDRRHHCGGMIA